MKLRTPQFYLGFYIQVFWLLSMRLFYGHYEKYSTITVWREVHSMFTEIV